jgi:hypothetical protein
MRRARGGLRPTPGRRRDTRDLLERATERRPGIVADLEGHSRQALAEADAANCMRQHVRNGMGADHEPIEPVSERRA